MTHQTGGGQAWDSHQISTEPATKLLPTADLLRTGISGPE